MNRGPEILLLVLMLTLPLSALLARRVPMARGARLAAIWLVIFTVVTALVLLWERS